MGDCKRYLDKLKSKECRCGRWKREGVSFCARCYWSLPEHLRVALYRPIGQGYEEAYEAAVRFFG